MESQASIGTSTAKTARYDTDFTICIMCQKLTEELLEKPNAQCKVLECTRDRAKCGDGHYPEVSRRLGKLTGQDLESKDASRHRTCYQHTVRTGMCKRAKERYEKNVADTSESSESCSSECGTFSRSQSVPYEK